MADITMCTNNLCPNATRCYRVTASPNEYWQSMAFFDYEVSENGVVCNNYWPTEKITTTNRTK